MYWARAKNIIIFLLFALNIFLAANLYIYNSDRFTNSEAAQSAQAILNARNIKLECKVPNIKGTAIRLNFVKDGFDKSLLVHNLMGIPFSDASHIDEKTEVKNSGKTLVLKSATAFSFLDEALAAKVDMTRDSAVIKFTEKYLREAGLLPKSYLVDKFEKKADNSVMIVFIEKYGRYLIYDNYLEVTVTEKGITGVQGSRRSIKKAEAVQQDSVMTAWQVLLRNYTGNTPLVIENIDFGFREDTEKPDEMKASLEDPVWRIKIKGDSNYRYFNAFNGEEIK